MKQFSFFIFSFFLFNGFISAQTITREHLPAVGNSVQGVYVTIQDAWNPGAAGVNQNWDFSAWAGDPIDFVYDAVDPTTAFAGAEMKLGLPGMGELYFNSSSTEYFLTGTYSSVGGENLGIPYSDPQKIFEFPMGYEDVIEDIASGSYTGPYTYMGFPIEATTVRTISSKSEADGTGTLVLPNNTYHNVLRVKITSTIKDSLYSSLAPGYHEIIRSTTEEYFYFSEDYKHQLVYMMKVVSEAQAEPIELAFYFPGATVLSNTASLINQFGVYPNPAHSVIHFKGIEAGTSLSIKNSLGVEVQSVSIIENQEIPVDALQPGVYFYELRRDGQLVRSGRFSKI